MNDLTVKNHSVTNTKSSKLNGLAAGLLSIAGLAVSSNVLADSNKILWPTNGHYYQRFERAFTYDEAKTYCESFGGHLATVTSSQEMIFIGVNLLDPASGSFYLGGSDAAQEGYWKWITGETWSYVNFQSNAPTNVTGKNYLSVDSYSWLWYDSSVLSSSIHGLICEWSYNNMISSTAVSDINGNGRDEIAALLVDYKTSKHIVQVRDGGTNAVLKNLVFSTNDVPPLSVATLNDINANGSPEIAVLYQDSVTSLARILIRDTISGALLKNVAVLNVNYTAKNMTVSPDLNGNGKSEITVIGVDKATGKTLTETRDSSTNAVLENAVF